MCKMILNTIWICLTIHFRFYLVDRKPSDDYRNLETIHKTFAKLHPYFSIILFNIVWLTSSSLSIWTLHIHVYDWALTFNNNLNQHYSFSIENQLLMKLWIYSIVFLYMYRVYCTPFKRTGLSYSKNSSIVKWDHFLLLNKNRFVWVIRLENALNS